MNDGRGQFCYEMGARDDNMAEMDGGGCAKCLSLNGMFTKRAADDRTETMGEIGAKNRKNGDLQKLHIPCNNGLWTN